MYHDNRLLVSFMLLALTTPLAIAEDSQGGEGENSVQASPWIGDAYAMASLRGFGQDEPEGDEDAEGDEPERPFRLLRLEEAYTQEEGEWQIRLTTGYSRGSFTEIEREAPGDFEVTGKTVKRLVTELEIEYGLSDRLEIVFAAPLTLWEQHRGSTRVFESGALDSSSRFNFDEEGLGDLSVSLAYALVEETESLPALTVEAGVILPTGNEGKGLGSGRGGFETGIAATKGWERLYATVNLEFGYIDGRSREFEYGIGALYFLSDERDWSVSLELDGSAEDEIEEGVWEHAVHITPGVSYGWMSEGGYAWQVGVGVPIGLTGLAQESDEFGVLLQLQVEF